MLIRQSPRITFFQSDDFGLHTASSQQIILLGFAEQRQLSVTFFLFIRVAISLNSDAKNHGEGETLSESVASNSMLCHEASVGNWFSLRTTGGVSFVLIEKT